MRRQRQKKAPVERQLDEGRNQNQRGRKVLVMSKATRKQRARKAPPRTIAADPRIVVIHEPEPVITVERPKNSYVDPRDVFSKSELASMPITIGNARRGRVRVWRGQDGNWYRHGGWLRIQPNREGDSSRLLIRLAKGANERDLNHLLGIAEQVRSGVTKRTWRKLSPEAPGLEWADDRTFSFAYTSIKYVDPYANEDRSPRVRACTEKACREAWHEVGGFHEIDSVRRELPAGGGEYSIRVTKPVDAKLTERWTVDVYTDEFYGTPEDVASFVSDLQWMQEECRSANASDAIVSAAA